MDHGVICQLANLDGSQPSHGLHSWVKMLRKLEDKKTRDQMLQYDLTILL